MSTCLLLGPPCTAHHLPGSPLAQCPGSLLLLFLLFCFISGSALPANPHPRPCLTQLLPPGPSPTTAMCPSVPIVCGPSQCQKVPTATAQTVFANNVTHLVFHHSGMRGCLPYMSVFPSFCRVLSLPPCFLPVPLLLHSWCYPSPSTPSSTSPAWIHLLSSWL